MDPEKIFLRPMTEADLTALGGMVNDPGALGEFQWFGWADPERFRRRWAECGLLSEEQSIFAVATEGEFLGFVAATRKAARPNTPYWSIGAQLMPQARGRGIGTQAHRLLVDYLFAHTTAVRVEADTDIGNLAEQRVLEKLGFTREGVHRSMVFRAGQWRDAVFYSLLRTDPRP